MSLLSDFLKEIPLSSVLQEKLKTLEANYDEVKAENASLKDDLREARAALKAAEMRVQQLTTPELDEKDRDILIAIVNGPVSSPNAAQVRKKMRGPERLAFGELNIRLKRLVDLRYLSAWSTGGPDNYSLEAKAREYLVKNTLRS